MIYHEWNLHDILSQKCTIRMGSSFLLSTLKSVKLIFWLVVWRKINRAPCSKHYYYLFMFIPVILISYLKLNGVLKEQNKIYLNIVHWLNNSMPLGHIIAT